MGRNAIFTETDIVQAGQYLEALHPGKTVSPGQIRDHLDGGNVGRIREIWERHLKQRAEAADRARAARISLPSELRTYLVAEEKSFTERIDELCGKVFDIAKKAVQAERAEEEVRLRVEIDTLTRKLQEADDENDASFESQEAAETRLAEVKTENGEERRRADRAEAQLEAIKSILADKNDELVAAQAENGKLLERAVRAEAELNNVSSHPASRRPGPDAAHTGRVRGSLG